MAPTLAIEFTDSDCRIAQVERVKGGRLQAKTLLVLPLPPVEDPSARVVERAHLLREALRENKIQPQSISVAIPKNVVMARTVTLPSADPDEIGGMARFEAEKYIPVNADRHIVSHHILAKQGVQGSDVVLTAVDQPVAQEYMEICTRAGLDVQRIGVSSLSVFNAVASTQPLSLQDKVVAVVNIGKTATDFVIATNGVVRFTRGSTLGVGKLLNEMQSAMPDGTLTAEDLVRLDALDPHSAFEAQAAVPAPPPAPTYNYDEIPGLSEPSVETSGMYPSISAKLAERSAEEPANHDHDLDDLEVIPPSASSPKLPEKAPAAVPPTPGNGDKKALDSYLVGVAFNSWLLRLLQEVKRTYEFAQREFNCPMVNTIILSGEGAGIRNLAEYFSRNFSVETALFNPLLNVDLPKNRVLPLGENTGPAFAGVMGLILSEGRPYTVSVNLVPPDYLEKKQAQKLQRSYITTGALAVVAILLGYFYLSEFFDRKRTLLEAYEEQNKKMKSQVTQLQGKKTRLNIIETHVKDDRSALQVLEEISKCPAIPQKVTLYRFEYNKDENLKLAGYAKDLPGANQFKDYLDKMTLPDGRTAMFENVEQDQGSLSKKTLRGKGTDEVLDFSITCSFPKRKVKKAKAASEESGTKEDSNVAE